MSILVSGSFYANFELDLSSITKNTLIKKYGQEKYDKIRYHIIMGDANFMWPGNDRAEKIKYEVLARRPFPILCVMGNEDPILGMSDNRETDIGIGETVYHIHDDPFVAYLKRGKVYTIDGYKFLVLGGARSLDKKKRVLNKTWWKEEYWSEKEKSELFKLLKTDNTFDLVISHTGPHKINYLKFGDMGDIYFHDEVAFLNDQIDERIQFQEWFCSHWMFHDEFHCDPETGKKYQYLFETTRVIDRAADGKIKASRGVELDKNSGNCVVLHEKIKPKEVDILL
jgi:hypothetical protein